MPGDFIANSGRSIAAACIFGLNVSQTFAHLVASQQTPDSKHNHPQSTTLRQALAGPRSWAVWRL
jgi:hypothetical protein